jgi:predicted small secreted protein
MKINFKSLAFFLVATLFLNGCHTAAGFGKDVQESGQAIQQAAVENQ